MEQTQIVKVVQGTYADKLGKTKFDGEPIQAIVMKAKKVGVTGNSYADTVNYVRAKKPIEALVSTLALLDENELEEVDRLNRELEDAE